MERRFPEKPGTQNAAVVPRRRGCRGRGRNLNRNRDISGASVGRFSQVRQHHGSFIQESKPLTMSRWFSLARASQAWIAPAHGNTDLNLDAEAVLCSFLNSKAQHLVILAVSGIHGVLTGLKAESGNVAVRVRCTPSSDAYIHELTPSRSGTIAPRTNKPLFWFPWVMISRRPSRQ